MMPLNQFKKSGQSAVELSLIAALVVGVCWSGLQLLNSKMTQGTSAFAGQYSGTAVATGTPSPGSGVAPSSGNGSAPSNLPSPVASPPPLPVTLTPATAAAGNSPSNAPSSGAVATVPAANPPIAPSLPVASGTNAGGLPVTSPQNTTPSSLPALPAAGDGCMGCAASMTTDLGW